MICPCLENGALQIGLRGGWGVHRVWAYEAGSCCAHAFMRVDIRFVGLMQIHVQRGEEELGVFSLEEAAQYLAEGRLVETDLARSEGLEDWVPLGGLCQQLEQTKPISGTTKSGQQSEGKSPATSDRRHYFGETKPISGSSRPAQGVGEEEPAVFGQGRYLREKVLGKGAQGEVWLAHDLQLDRQVAIKQVNEHFAPGTTAFQSLKDEVQKSLELTHPNITRIYDLVDVPGEPPFISMEYLEGEDLHVKMEKQEGDYFSWAEIEPYILSLCDALEYAHGQGMVHRDLKPANLIITDTGELKLTDMGIAEPAKDPDAPSETEDFISGTPLYWSPQQSQGIKSQATDDIYSLGATLYHLLTGRLPFQGDTEPEITQQHLTKPPEDLQQVLSDLGRTTRIPPHINALVLKCLAKDPASRPQGMGYIRAWIQGKGDPVVRRQKRMALVAGMSVVLVAMMGALTVWALIQRSKALEEREKAERQSYYYIIALVKSRMSEGDYEQVRTMLWATPKEFRGWEWGRLMHSCRRDLLTLQGHEGYVSSVNWSPSGKQLATGSMDTTVKLWDGSTGKLLHTLSDHQDFVTSVAWSPNGERLASGSWDKTIKLWDTANGQLIKTLQGHAGSVWSTTWSPDGKRLASSGGEENEPGEVKVWDAKSGRIIHSLEGHQQSVQSVSWSPDGKKLASGSWDKTVKVWDTANGQLIDMEGEHNGSVWSVAWSPDGQRLASGGGDNNEGGEVKVWVWNDSDRKYEIKTTLKGHKSSVRSVFWSPDGKWLASGSDDRLLKMWEADSGELQHTMPGHAKSVWSVAWSPDGTRLVSGSSDNTVKIWEVPGNQEPNVLKGHTEKINCVAWSPSGEYLASASEDHTVKIWESASGSQFYTLTDHTWSVWSVAWSPDGNFLASGSGDNTIKVWEINSGKLLHTLQSHTDEVKGVAWSPDGQRLASASADKTVTIWEVAKGKLLRTFRGHKGTVMSVSWSPDGKRLASGSKDDTVRVWEVAGGKLIHTLQSHTDSVRCVSWSPDGKQLASGSGEHEESGEVKTWEAASGQLLYTLQGHKHHVYSVAWSPDGKRLASGSRDNTVKIWEAAGGQELLSIKAHNERVQNVAWSPDGLRLASGSWDKTVKLWRSVDWTMTSEQFEEQKRKRYQAFQDRIKN
jgi:WD40 repeat protein